MTVGLAFEFFFQKRVDIAIIEVGLGGRLDSTNIVTPELSVITNIGLDHTRFLGDTLTKIATEKAGIIKANTPVVIGESQTEVNAIFTQKASNLKSDIYFADQEISQVLDCSLLGNYQQKNIKTALKALGVLETRGFSISQQQLKKGLLSVQKIQASRALSCSKSPNIICDTAITRG